MSLKNKKRSRIKSAVISIGVLCFLFFVVFTIHHIIYVPRINSDDYFNIKPISSQYVLCGEDRDFEITYMEDYLGKLSKNDLWIEGANADKELKRKSKNHYVLTLSNIQPQNVNNTNINELIPSNGIPCAVVLHSSISNNSIQMALQSKKLCNFFIVKNYVCLSGKVHKGLFNSIYFDIEYRGDNYAVTLNSYDVRLANASGNVEMINYRFNPNKVKIKIKNINNVMPGETLKLYMSGGTSISEDFSQSNEETFDLGIDMSTQLEEMQRMPIIIIIAFFIAVVGAIINIKELYGICNNMYKKIKRNKPYPIYHITEVTNLKQLIYNVPSYDNSIAFIYSKGRKATVEITYSQFIRDIEAFGTYLYSQGIKDTHIAVIGENSYEWILTYFAAVLGGNVIVPIDKELSNAEIENVLPSSDSTVLVYSNTYADVAEELNAHNPDILYINMKDIEDILSLGLELISLGQREYIDYKVNDDDLAAIVYTSGTTGVSKGVMLSHKNIASNAVAACKNVQAKGSTVAVLPFHHTFSFTLGICAILLSRQTIYINKSLKNITSDMQKATPAYMFLVPMIVEGMYKKVWATAEEQGKAKALKILIKFSNALLKIGIDIRRKLFRSVIDAFGGNFDWVGCGGAAIDIKYIKGFRDFGINIINGYGITECSPIVASNRPKYWVDGSVGVPVEGCSIKINNPNADGEGEILVKGSGVMIGYYKNAAATEQAFIGDWFRTGDIGKYENGVLYITGRTKNVIILSNGKNIYPEELELLLSEIAGIAECMVYEENKLLTVEIYADKDSDTADIKERIHRLNQTLPPHKQITAVKFRDTEFEKTTTKKIKRR